MGEIVEDLRRCNLTNGLLLDAADEIEQQRRQIAELTRDNDKLREELNEAISAMPQAVRSERQRCALVVEGWSTAENYLPDIPKRTGGWLADRDLTMGEAIRENHD